MKLVLQLDKSLEEALQHRLYLDPPALNTHYTQWQSIPTKRLSLLAWGKELWRRLPKGMPKQKRRV